MRVGIALITTAILWVALGVPAKAVTCIDPLNKVPAGCTPRSGGGILGGQSADNPIQDLIKMLVDTDEAVRLSTAIASVQDPVGGSCWKSFSGMSEVIKAHPDILTGKASADLEALRLLHISLNQVCANPNCGQMWNDLQNIVTAINPISLPVSLTSICAKIPVIGTSVAPTAPPVVTPATAPATIVPTTPGGQ